MLAVTRPRSEVTGHVDTSGASRENLANQVGGCKCAPGRDASRVDHPTNTVFHLPDHSSQSYDSEARFTQKTSLPHS